MTNLALPVLASDSHSSTNPQPVACYLNKSQDVPFCQMLVTPHCPSSVADEPTSVKPRLAATSAAVQGSPDLHSAFCSCIIDVCGVRLTLLRPSAQAATILA